MNSESQQDLVNIIRGVHEKLRNSFHSTGDFDKIWKDHLAEVDLRKKYASAMMKLATQIWNKKQCRILWSYETCMNYFFNGGIEQSILRELKIKEKWSPSMTEKLKSLENLSHERNNYKSLNRKLKLLDVGSCYNPFSKFSIFLCTAIDLTPATDDILQCDFLSLEVKNHFEVDTPFVKESFDVVVFSLVLEYLPAKKQRIIFCIKAWELLQKNGLLIIITPDSKNVQRNAPMMKSWKIALEKNGFIRIKYEKLTHLHCMAFRKTSKSMKIDTCIESLSELMYIPQDFKKYNAAKQYCERDDNENYCVYKQFSVLPNEDLF